MSDSSPKNADFNWPPTDEELAECFYSGPPDEQLPQRGVEVSQETISDGTDFRAEATFATGQLVPLETSTGPLETLSPPPAAGSVHDTSLNGFEPEASGARKSDWATEMTRLQALIEKLTDTV